jgi:hypothetical protein
MWNVAPEGHSAYDTIVRYDRLRDRLLPYVYSLAGSVTHEAGRERDASGRRRPRAAPLAG